MTDPRPSSCGWVLDREWFFRESWRDQGRTVVRPQRTARGPSAGVPQHRVPVCRSPNSNGSRTSRSDPDRSRCGSRACGRATPAPSVTSGSRYRQPLVRVAANRMSRNHRRARGPEDLVADVILEFCRLVTAPGASARFPQLSTRANLWGLLQMHDRACAARSTTIKKGRSTERRSWGANRSAGPAGLDACARNVAEPPGFAAGLAELLALLDAPKYPERGEALKTVALMSMEGYRDGEIAAKLKCSVRSVERKMELIRKRLDAHRPAGRGEPDSGAPPVAEEGGSDAS